MCLKFASFLETPSIELPQPMKEPEILLLWSKTTGIYHVKKMSVFFKSF